LNENFKKCPKCGSKNITLWMGSTLGTIYYCEDCKYRGPLIIEEEK